MAATRASGTTAVRYGTMRDAVLGLTVVTADGKAIKTGGRARKSSAGYDLTRLFVGAEGTLGIISEVTLRLHGRPEATAVATCWFESIDAAVDAVIMIVQLGIPVARVELMDETQVEAVNTFSKLNRPVAPTLFFEFHGLSDAAVEENLRSTADIVSEHGGREFARAVSPEDRAKLWQARHDAYYASLALRPGTRAWTTDVCVPISRLAQCIHETKADLADSPLVGPLVGHVGDGNFHLVVLFDPQDPGQRASAEGLAERVSMRAIAMGGTCTGEHGIGVHKLHALVAEHGEAVDLMRTIKRALDPHGIMNPGKTVPP
jgi:D-lactate dehydrogenase (cytochrome)